MRYLTPVFLLITTLFIALFHTEAYNYVPLLVICLLIGYTFLLNACYKQTIVTNKILENVQKSPSVQITFHKNHPFRIQGTYQILCQHTISGEQQQLSGVFSTAQRVHTISCPTTWSHCGNMQVVKGTVTFTDPLTWCQITKDLTSERATLWPNLHFLEPTALTHSTSHAIGNEAGERERLVPYTPGEAVHAIHWPLSAKLQTLMIQKPAFAASKQELLALYFNDLTHIEEYDTFMNTCYRLLNEEHFNEVCIWAGTWKTFSIQSPQEVTALFHYLLQQPLEQLYAPSLPPNLYKTIRYKGETVA